MARTRWPPGSVNPGLLHRTGRSDRHRRWVPKEPGPRPAGRFAGQPAGVSRFAGQAGTQARPYARTTANQRKQGRTTTYILPADYALVYSLIARTAERGITINSVWARGAVDPMRTCLGRRWCAWP